MRRKFKYFVKNKDVVFKYAQGSSVETGKDFHLFNEIIWFLDGDAELIGENLHIKITPRTVIVIPKETYHQIVIKGDPDSYRCWTLHFPAIPENESGFQKELRQISVFEQDPDFAFLFNKLIEAAQNPIQHAIEKLLALLTLILCELSEKNDMAARPHGQSELIMAVVNYINRNLSGKLRIQDIAKAICISPSSLAHTFKEGMHISIYQYILKKRLMLAHRKISDGQLASTVAVECGFNDYSGFYKQYKKMFNRVPSQKG